jgi:quercetin dioxygenase-like cupin family protein
MLARLTAPTGRSVLAASTAAAILGLGLVAAFSGPAFLSARDQDPVRPVPAAGTSDRMKSGMTVVSKDSATIAGEAIAYPGNLAAEISSATFTIPPGATTRWMTHPTQGYIYVLEGALTVEFADGPQKTFKSGQAFLQTRTKWHRGRNDGNGPVRFLAVFFGAKGVPNVLHPPDKR